MGFKKHMPDAQFHFTDKQTCVRLCVRFGVQHSSYSSTQLTTLTLLQTTSKRERAVAATKREREFALHGNSAAVTDECVCVLVHRRLLLHKSNVVTHNYVCISRNRGLSLSENTELTRSRNGITE